MLSILRTFLKQAAKAISLSFSRDKVGDYDYQDLHVFSVQ